MTQPMQLSLPLPRSLDTRIYIHLTVKSRAIVLLLTTASAEQVGTLAPMGSFVYALPDVCASPPPPARSPAPAADRVPVEIQPGPAPLDAAAHRRAHH